jgi:hypothetical protein
VWLFLFFAGVLNLIVYLRPRFAKVHAKRKLHRKQKEAGLKRMQTMKETIETVEEIPQQQDELQVVEEGEQSGTVEEIAQQQDEAQVVEEIEPPGSAAEIEKKQTTPTKEDEDRAEDDAFAPAPLTRQRSFRKGLVRKDNPNTSTSMRDRFGAASKSLLTGSNFVRGIMSEMKEVLLEGDKGAASGESEVSFTELSQIQEIEESADEDPPSTMPDELHTIPELPPVLESSRVTWSGDVVHA